MRKLLRHLKVSVDEERINCIEKHLSGAFHRVNHQQEDPWSPELHSLINNAITKANTMLVDKIGRPLPLEKYEFFSAK